MSNCIYCGKKAGFLKKYHKQCRLLYETGKSEIVTLVNHSIQNEDLIDLYKKIENIAQQSYIKDNLTDLLISGFETTVEIAFEDGILSKDEENIFNNFFKYFSLSQSSLDRNGAYTKIVKGSVLREVLNGNIPQRMDTSENLPFNLQKNENIVWVFQNVEYYEQQIKTQFIGGSKSVSVRLAKGLYYRTGAFKGEKVQTTDIIHLDNGLLGITNKQIYFAGPSKCFRVAYNKIVTFEPYSDGIGIQKDTATAKPQTFITGDGWFTYNLITNLAHL